MAPSHIDDDPTAAVPYETMSELVHGLPRVRHLTAVARRLQLRRAGSDEAARLGANAKKGKRALVLKVLRGRT